MTATASLENIINITSAAHFQEVLSKDLNRVSLLNFWAPWAEPCKHMGEVVVELGKKYPHVLILQVRSFNTHHNFLLHRSQLMPFPPSVLRSMYAILGLI